MKVVVAIDSFKGSMTSMQAGNACKEGILAAAHAAVGRQLRRTGSLQQII